MKGGFHYIVRTERGQHLWFSHRVRPGVSPRLVQLLRMARCALQGHDWSLWALNDYDATPFQGEIGMMCRKSRPGEHGVRRCNRNCGLIEIRHPVKQAPRLFQGKHRVGEH